jgi:hypothetical protein
MMPRHAKDAIARAMPAVRDCPRAPLSRGAQVQRDQCTSAYSNEFDIKSHCFKVRLDALRVRGQDIHIWHMLLFRAIGRRFMKFRGYSVAF